MTRPMTGAAVTGTMVMDGVEYDIIRFGCRLRVVGRRNNRSLDSKGYMDLQEIRRKYPRAMVTAS